MIVKINYIEHYDGGLTINKVLKVKLEKVKPLFEHIRWFPFAKQYKKVVWGNGIQYVYLFNTDVVPYFKLDSDNDIIYKHLYKLAQGFIRDFKLNEILNDI